MRPFFSAAFAETSTRTPENNPVLFLPAFLTERRRASTLPPHPATRPYHDNRNSVCPTSTSKALCRDTPPTTPAHELPSPAFFPLPPRSTDAANGVRIVTSTATRRFPVTPAGSATSPGRCTGVPSTHRLRRVFALADLRGEEDVRAAGAGGLRSAPRRPPGLQPGLENKPRRPALP